MQRRKKRAAANPPPRGRQQQQPPPPPQPQVQPQQQQLPPQLARPSAIHREIQTFYGGAADEVDSWFLHLYLAALQQWDEATKLREAVAALGPGVRREYAAFEVITRPARVGWAEFERYMRTTYGPKQPVDFWTTRLMNIKQATQEAMKDYISRFRLMSTSLVQAEQADGDGGRVSQRMLIVWFKHGLRPEFQPDLIRAEPIATLTDAYQAAEKAEVVWKALLKRPHPLGEVYASHPAAIAMTTPQNERQRETGRTDEETNQPGMAAQVKQLAAEVQRLSKIVQENKRLSLAKCSKVSQRGGDVMTPLINGHALWNSRLTFREIAETADAGVTKQCIAGERRIIPARDNHSPEELLQRDRPLRDRPSLVETKKPSPTRPGLESMPCRLRMITLLPNLAALTYQRILCE